MASASWEWSGRKATVLFDVNVATNPKVAVVNPSDYQVVGQPTARVDLPAKFLARFEYVQNVVVPGMLHASFVRSLPGCVRKAVIFQNGRE